MLVLALLISTAQAHLDVLVYGPTESYEEAAILADGGKVTVWTETQWRAAKTSDFEKFHVIIVGDKDCSGPSSSELKALYDTRATWTAAVEGNIVVSGINPACHESTESAAGELFLNAVTWAGDSGGAPGLVVFSDFGTRDLDFLSKWGTFDTVKRADDSVTVLESTHPVFNRVTALSASDLSGWGDSVSSYLKTVPTGWDVIADDSNGDPIIAVYDDCDADYDTYLAARCGGLDCDDSSYTIKPGATEYCDGIDNDCDKTIDESDAVDVKTWYRDADSDGWGDLTTWVAACSVPTGYGSSKGDCDDSKPLVYPGADEYCNGYDDDCDTLVDEPSALDAVTFWFDLDADGYGDVGTPTTACSAPGGYVDNDDDCDDTDFRRYPGNTEIAYDGIDQDCDGDDLCDVDVDGDDHPDCGGSDCDDTDDTVYTGASDTWYDGVDSDCDGWSDYDADRDGDDSDAYGGGDCDDTDPTVYAGAPEISDGKDNDCNGFAEDDDGDGDGLTSEEELVLGTDVANGDSDGDGLSDGEEVGSLTAPRDSDRDGILDVFDPDDDNDGLATAVEIGAHDWKDPISFPDDSDGDLEPDHLDLDSDNDGRSDTFEGVADPDGDGLGNFKDADSDGDGVGDLDESEADLDGDELPDWLDDDDDGDGLPTLAEGPGDPDEDGAPNFRDLDSDGDGHLDSVEGLDDFDSDGLADFVDLDSDDDGLLDAIEADSDSDGDDWPDRVDVDDDGDTLPTAFEAFGGLPVDSDGDGTMDHLDPDSDQDGYLDVDEGAVDSDGDGVRDSLDLDSEGDGIDDIDEVPVDTDGDGLIDRLDLDDDNDGLPGAFEGTIDTDGDGLADHRDSDSDGDGRPDAVEGYRDSDCDGTRDYVDADDEDGPCIAPNPWPDVVLDLDAEPDTGCATVSAAHGQWWLLMPAWLVLWGRRRRGPVVEDC